MEKQTSLMRRNKELSKPCFIDLEQLGLFNKLEPEFVFIEIE